MARRGIARLLLRGRLLAWRLAYRLRTLSISSNGRQLTASASPAQTTQLGLTDLPDEFLRDCVRRIVDRMMLSPEADRAESRMRNQAGLHTLSEQSDILGYVRMYSDATTPILRGRSNQRVVAFVQRQRAFRTVETGAPFFSSTANQLVGTRAGSYPGFIRRVIDHAARTGQLVRSVWRNFARFARGDGRGRNAAERELFAELRLLITGREAIRSAGMSTADSVFAMDVMARGGLAHEMFDRNPAQTGAQFPMAVRGAQRNALESDAGRFQRTFGYPVAMPSENPSHQYRDLRRESAQGIENGEALRRYNSPAAANERNRRHWELTPLGQYQARREGRPAGSIWEPSANPVEARQAALIREWLRLQREDLMFASLIEARQVIEELVSRRLAEHYNVPSLVGSRSADPEIDAFVERAFLGL
jgi:hypothetical protein